MALEGELPTWWILLTALDLTSSLLMGNRKETFLPFLSLSTVYGPYAHTDLHRNPLTVCTPCSQMHRQTNMQKQMHTMMPNSGSNHVSRKMRNFEIICWICYARIFFKKILFSQLLKYFICFKTLEALRDAEERFLEVDYLWKINCAVTSIPSQGRANAQLLIPNPPKEEDPVGLFVGIRMQPLWLGDMVAWVWSSETVKGRCAHKSLALGSSPELSDFPKARDTGMFYL